MPNTGVSPNMMKSRSIRSDLGSLMRGSISELKAIAWRPALRRNIRRRSGQLAKWTQQHCRSASTQKVTCPNAGGLKMAQLGKVVSKGVRINACPHGRREAPHGRQISVNTFGSGIGWPTFLSFFFAVFLSVPVTVLTKHLIF